MVPSKPHGKSSSFSGSMGWQAAFLIVALTSGFGLSAQMKKTPSPKITATAAAQMKVLQAIKVGKTPEQNKIGSRLYMGLQNLRDPELKGALPDFRFVKNESDGRIPVDIILAKGAGVKPVLKKLESLGEIVRGKSPAFRRISARVRLQNLEALAAMPEILKVRQAIPRRKSVINVSEGDATHGADEARAFFGNIGSGVKIGVISDGVDSLASLQASGDLPPSVQVLPGQEGAGDEGSAMLEIVHDLAPGAALAFATADPDEAQFAQNILDLAAAGCNIIVDDILYLAESPFEDGPVAQAVNTVTAGGVLYFSSAGNEGNADDLTSGTWEGDFLLSAAADPTPLAGADLHDFGDGGNSILVEFGGGNPPLLIWAEHYDLATGLASTDFDLYDMDGGLTTVFDASFDEQNGVGGDDFPIEFIEGGTFGGERLVIDRFTAGLTSSAPVFNLILLRGELDDNLVTSGATRGHSAAADAFSVAATPAADSFDGISPDGPFPGLFTSANESESFTSDGPRRIILTTAGAEITPGNRTSTGGVVRQKPDITAADGVATAAPTFDPFYGTSASAPHAAAIAALIKSSVPLITPAQVRTALVSTAIDIETPGVDRDTGAGIVMAHAAMAAAGAVPGPLLSAGTAVPTQAAGDGDAFVENNEIWNLSIPLTNIGPLSATAVSGTLSTTTPGVVIAPNVAAYPDLAPAATASNLTPFTFTVGPSVECGVFIEFTLTVTYAGGGPSPQAFDFTIQTGQPGTPVVFSYVGPAVPIPDGGDAFGTLPGAPISASLLVSGLTGRIYDIDLRIDGSACSATVGSTTVGIDHSFVNDLEIKLISPSAINAMIINNTDGGGNNFCQTRLNDDGGDPSIQSVADVANPFTGSFTPSTPLSIYDGEVGNGTWQLQAQDYFEQDTGNIRTFSLIITPAVCDAPTLGSNVNGTKTVAGTFSAGGTVTYTVTLTNTGGTAQLDNAGNEFIDVLPGSLTLVSAVASSGTPTANVNPNEVTWNGTLAPVNGSVTITITATVNNVPGGTVVSNQGTINYDGDGNNTNEASRLTDDPGVGGASDPTNFTVLAANVTGTKTASAGPYNVGDNVTYTITLSNSGNAPAGDNAGNEFTDVLPSGLTLVSANASSGTPVANVGTNTVTWNGSIPASGSVTITIVATINASAGGTTVTNQGSFSFDANQDGVNESTGNTDDPGTGASGDGTAIVVAGAALDSLTKTVSGSFTPNSLVTYTIVITNTGDATQGDNAGNELTDILPPQLTLTGATASSGTPVATIGTNTVTWNGSIPAGGSVTITITALLEAGNEGVSVCNQATHIYDGDDDGVNETTVVSDNPITGAANDATCFVGAAVAVAIPTASELGLLLLAVGLAMLAAWKVLNS